jgi:alpha-galactosidase
MVKVILSFNNLCNYKYFGVMNIFITFVVVISAVVGLDNGLGKTPPMGWNSWNRFACGINETLIRQTADLMVSTGLAAKGYRYINLDDCWQIDRNATTKEIIEDKTKFPSGMAALGEYIHSKGLLYGLYSDAGYKTCEGRPGSLGYETIDANTYAKWK